MQPANKQLPLVTVPPRLLALPEAEGICLPANLKKRLSSLITFANQKAAWISENQKSDKEQAAMLSQSLVFSCYQILSLLVAWECWALFNKECIEENGIIIDNLTGIMAPLPARCHYAGQIAGRLFKTQAMQGTARDVYRLTSAQLHSYPHLSALDVNIRTRYRDLDGKWHVLGPCSPVDLLGGIARVLLAWS